MDEWKGFDSPTVSSRSLTTESSELDQEPTQVDVSDSRVHVLSRKNSNTYHYPSTQHHHEDSKRSLVPDDTKGLCGKLSDVYFNTLDAWLQACLDWFDTIILPYVPPSVQHYCHYLERQFNGWRFGVFTCAISVFIVLITNITYALWVYKRHGFVDGIGIIIEGNCRAVHNYNFVGHLFINVFSTILLSGSNYCMQCLCAPTRQDVDRAHAKGRALDIGTQSFTNLSSISLSRTIAWLLLGLSSVPLHLMYNSVMYTTISTNGYEILAVNEAFLRDVPVNKSGISYELRAGKTKYYHFSPGYEYEDQTPGLFPDQDSFRNVVMDLHHQAVAGSLERLDKEACMQAYAVGYLSKRRNLLLVTDNPPFQSNEGNVFLAFGVPGLGNGLSPPQCSNFQWICNRENACESNCASILSKYTSSPENWTPFNVDLSYCMSQRVEAHCKLQISSHIVLIVIVFNICKAAIMCFLAFRMKEKPLLTVGDALTSFLTEPDAYTKNSCLATKHDFNSTIGSGWFGLAKQWTDQRIAWCRACTPWRWAYFVVLFIICLTLVTSLFAYGIVHNFPQGSFSYAMSLGFGVVQSITLIGMFTVRGTAGLLKNIILTNCPQPILSLVYLAYNGLFTSMLSGLEWSRYAWHKKGLRVSVFPEGEQRTTYFLQLPYRYALPIMVLSAILHWMVSQGLFMVALEPYHPDGRAVGFDSPHCLSSNPPPLSCTARSPTRGQSITVGWSPCATFASLMVALTMIFTAVAMSFRHYRVGLPVAGTSSAAMSATCHLSHRERQELARKGISPALEKLQWGVVPSSSSKYGRCAFSTGDVTLPEQGVFYS